MSLDKVGIMNLAVGWLGGNLIVDPDSDESTEADLCRANYESSRDFTLESRNWTFAKDRARLVPEEDTPAFQWSFQFLLPAQVIRVVQVCKDPQMKVDTDWERESNKILADVAIVYVTFVEKVEIEARFSPGFTQTFATKLAENIALPLTASKTMYNLMKQNFVDLINDAGALDGQQGKNKRLKSNQLTGRR